MQSANQPMLFSFLFALLATTSVFAIETGHNDKKTLACTRELQGIVHIPETCSLKLLRRLSLQLREQSELIFGTPAQVKYVFESFMQQNQVKAGYVDAFGNIVSPTGIPIPPDYSKAMTHTLAQAYAIGEGFTANVIAETAPAPLDTYATVIRNSEGEMLTVGIILRSDQAPLFC